jgi:signal peptidase I
MKQTLQDGDCLILLSSIFYRNPKPGDIVVASKSSFKDGEPIIKRVIAVEGQKVDIDFAKGIVYVDDVALDEPYINTPTNLFEGVEFPLVVKSGCVFVMGDNRNDSKDSRSPDIGMVDCRELLGKVLILAIPGKDAVTDQRDLGRIGVLW